MRGQKITRIFKNMAEPPLLSIEPNAGDYDYVDPDKDRQRGAEESLRRERLREVESAILSTPAGREWLWGILSGLHVFEQRIAMSTSEYENGFWAGEREGGLRLLRRFTKVSPEHFSRMFVENDHENDQ